MITLFELFHYMHSANIKKNVFLIQQRTRKSVSVVMYKRCTFRLASMLVCRIQVMD